MAKAKTKTVPSMPAEITPDDPHYHIPRDANGLPIFFILEPGVRRRYDQRLARCEQGWRATGNPGFVKEAQIWVHLHRQPPPLWLSEAVIALAERRQGKGHTKRATRAAIRLMRYQAMLSAPPPGRCCDLQTGRVVTWPDARADAARRLAKGPARGGVGAVKADYERVKKDLEQGRGGLYLQPLPTFGRKLRDVLNGKHRPAGIKS
jgi:hypothetical protein